MVCSSCCAFIFDSSIPSHLAIAQPVFSHNLPICPTVFCHTSDTHCVNQATAAPICLPHSLITHISPFCLSAERPLARYFVSPPCFSSALFWFINSNACALSIPAAFTFFKKATSFSENHKALACDALAAASFFCWSWTTTAFLSSVTSCGLTTVPNHHLTHGCTIGCNIDGIAID